MTTPSELLDALCARDFERVTACFTDDASLRAVLPPRYLEADGVDDVVGWLRRWYEGADDFEVVDSSADEVAGRARLSWRFRVRPHPTTGDERWHVIEQIVFCNEDDGAITGLDLLCSGFRPE